MKKMVVDSVYAVREVAVLTKGTITEESLPSEENCPSGGNDFCSCLNFFIKKVP